MTRLVRVLLVDDQHLVRAGLRILLDRTDDISVVGEAADGEQAVAACRAQQPDVVLMDIRMPGIGGIEATRRITADPDMGEAQVVMLTTFDTDEHIFDAIRAGAAGYLLKDEQPDELRRAIRAAAAGEALLSPAVTRRVMAAAATSPVGGDRPDLLADLTEREVEVLGEIGRGKSNDEVASVLFISPATARTYVSRLLAKLNARDRAQLVVIAYEAGLVRVHE